jgi:hypothetical protein
MKSTYRLVRIDILVLNQLQPAPVAEPGGCVLGQVCLPSECNLGLVVQQPAVDWELLPIHNDVIHVPLQEEESGLVDQPVLRGSTGYMAIQVDSRATEYSSISKLQLRVCHVYFCRSWDGSRSYDASLRPRQSQYQAFLQNVQPFARCLN